MDTQEFTLTVNFRDGHQEHFALPVQADKFHFGDLLDKLVNQSVLCLALEDSLFIIPKGSIRSAEVTPIPAAVPETVLHGVSRVS